MKTWYKAEVHDDGVWVTFQTGAERYWPPQVMETQPLKMEDVEGRRVVLKGKGALWMYMHAAVRAVQGGAACVIVEQMPGPVRIEVYRRGGVDGGQGEAAWYRRSDTAGGSVLVWFAEAEQGRWAPEILNDIAGGLTDVHGKDVYVTGAAANWMAAGMALAALRGGAAAVWYCSPMLSPDEAVNVVNGRTEEMPESVLGELRLKHAGIVVGVVGDPNSGKSVFSRLLYNELRRMKKDCWLLDCDAASPTAPWYLMATGTSDETQAATERDEQKVRWTDELEDKMAAHMKNVRWYEEVTIADLPGGRHDDARGIHERIPRHREVMMRAADVFIVITRDGLAIADAWRKELAQHGLENRIVAVIESRQPEAALGGKVWKADQKLVQGWLEGLRRDVLAQQPVPEARVVRELWEKITGG